MAKERKRRSGATRKKKRVLSDHQQVGKRFVPPMQQIGPWKDANWVGVILPELVWIGLLNQYYGWVKGADLSLLLARAAVQATGIDPREFTKKFGKGPKQMFATTTAYASLSNEQKLATVEHLKIAHELESIVKALAPLALWYPECPLNFLFESSPDLEGRQDLEKFKALLSELFDRYGDSATFMMANATYIAFCTNKIKVIVSDDRSSEEDSKLANFRAIKDFPNTEESRAVGASIRASIGVLVVEGINSTEWPDYFWNRGLELEVCDYQRIYDTYE